MFGFAFFIIAGTVLLSLPVSSANETQLRFIDALFTATSALCVTGLTVVDTGAQFTLFGQVVMLVLVQMGGIGFMTMATWFAIAFRRKISLKERLILKESMNHSNLQGIVYLIRRVILYSLTVEGVAALILALRWSADMSPGQAIYHGIFHAVSIFNNAGFILFEGFTQFVNDPVVNIVSILLIILGGLGFIVLSELLEYTRTRKLSLHSQVVLSVTFILITLGTVVIFIFEFTNGNTLSALSWDGKFFASLFQSVSLRSSGTNTLDIAELRQATQFFMIVLMFIGAAPGSTGGGIRVTTFAIMIAAFITMIRGKQEVVLFRRRIGGDLIFKSVTITLMSIFMIVVSTMILTVTEQVDLFIVLFEVVSAFGTVGMSMGLTPDLSDFGKVAIIVLMFVGRLGPFTLAYALKPKAQKELYRYPEGKVIIG